LGKKGGGRLARETECRTSKGRKPKGPRMIKVCSRGGRDDNTGGGRFHIGSNSRKENIKKPRILEEGAVTGGEGVTGSTRTAATLSYRNAREQTIGRNCGRKTQIEGTYHDERGRKIAPLKKTKTFAKKKNKWEGKGGW